MTENNTKTDEEIRKEAFLAGYTAARKSGFTSNELGPVTQRTAEAKFDRWYLLEVDESI